MPKRTGPTNPLLKDMIEELRNKSREKKSPFLKELSEKLNKPRRQRVEVNIKHIEGHTKKGETVVVPGNVLGYGEMTKAVTVGAWRFSEPARKKIEDLKGKALSIKELVDKNPKGTGVRILC